MRHNEYRGIKFNIQVCSFERGVPYFQLAGAETNQDHSCVNLGYNNMCCCAYSTTGLLSDFSHIPEDFMWAWDAMGQPVSIPIHHSTNVRGVYFPSLDRNPKVMAKQLQAESSVMGSWSCSSTGLPSGLPLKTQNRYWVGIHTVDVCISIEHRPVLELLPWRNRQWSHTTVNAQTLTIYHTSSYSFQDHCYWLNTIA